MLLHKNLHTMTRDPRDNRNEVKRRKHVSTMERLDICRKNSKKRDDLEENVIRIEGDMSIVH